MSQFLEDALRIDNQMSFPLYALGRLVVQTYAPMMSDLKLTYPQYLVVLLLWEKDGQTLQSLGNRLFLDSGTLTPLLQKMERAGLINRVRSAKDQRTVHNFLTEKAHALRPKVLYWKEIMYRESGLTSEQVAAVRSTSWGLLEQFLNLRLDGESKVETPAPASC